MERVGKLPGKGRYIILVTQDEFYELKAKNFSITDSIPMPRTLGILTKNMSEDFENLVEPEYHKSILWQAAKDFFDIRIRTNYQTLKFKQLHDLNKLKRQGKTFSPAQRKMYKQELMRRNRTIESWYRSLLEIREDGYSEEYISKILVYILNDITSKENIEKMVLSKRRVWRGWGLNVFSLNYLKKKSSNGLTKWDNIVSDYERKLEKSFSFLRYSPQLDEYEV